MARTGSRIHRLPQRLDYALIPAPLDLSLPPASPRSPLPAIIVTPADPTHEHDFSIAFLASPVKPSLRQRLATSLSPKLVLSSMGSPKLPQFSIPFEANHIKLISKPKLKQLFLFLLLIFIAICHVLTARLFAGSPVAKLEFTSRTYSSHRQAQAQMQLGLAAAGGAGVRLKGHLGHAHHFGNQALAVGHRDGDEPDGTNKIKDAKQSADDEEKGELEFLVIEDADGEALPVVDNSISI